jgi:hypothetical protein
MSERSKDKRGKEVIKLESKKGSELTQSDIIAISELIKILNQIDQRSKQVCPNIK